MKTFQDKVKPTQIDPITPEDLKERLEGLKQSKPEWFIYSDTLGERPIDGMFREMQKNWNLFHLDNQIKATESRNITEQIKRNKQIAPDYTNEIQQAPGLQPGQVRKMGPIM